MKGRIEETTKGGCLGILRKLTNKMFNIASKHILALLFI